MHFQIVSFTVDEMDIEESFGCVFDSLKLYDGQDSNAVSLGSLCGSRVPQQRYTSTNYLYLEFSSDSTIEFSGFHAIFEAVDPSLAGKKTMYMFPCEHLREHDAWYNGA